MGLGHKTIIQRRVHIYIAVILCYRREQKDINTGHGLGLENDAILVFS
jgi:hypothetical protein